MQTEMKKKAEFKGIGTVPGAILFIGAFVFIMAGIWGITKGNIFTYYYGYYSRERDMQMRIITACVYLAIIFGVVCLVKFVNCLNNSIIVYDNVISIQYTNPLSLKFVKKKAEISVKQIMDVSIEKQGVFQYVIISTRGEQHRIAIEDPEGVKKVIVECWKKHFGVQI